MGTGKDGTVSMMLSGAAGVKVLGKRRDMDRGRGPESDGSGGKFWTGEEVHGWV